MRIISGTHRGRVIEPPRNLRARPTTDFAKENLFNVLGNMVDFEGLRVLDLFAGTGSISYEFASRGASEVTAVEINAVHYNYIRRTAAEFGFDAIHAVKANVFLYLKALARKFDVVFSDAPYDLTGTSAVIDMVLGADNPAGMLGISPDAGSSVSPVVDSGILTLDGVSPVADSGVLTSDSVSPVGGSGILTSDGLLVFEHGRGADYSSHPRFTQMREYGSVVFSFFR